MTATRIDAALEAALERLTPGIGDLRSLIADLRPAALDELGIKPALETLAGRSEVDIDLDVALGGPAARGHRVDDLPRRPGGADQRRQARRRPRA